MESLWGYLAIWIANDRAETWDAHRATRTRRAVQRRNRTAARDIYRRMYAIWRSAAESLYRDVQKNVVLLLCIMTHLRFPLSRRALIRLPIQDMRNISAVY